MVRFFRFGYYTPAAFILLLFFLSGCEFCDCEKEQDSLSPIRVSERDQKEMVLVPSGEFIMGTDKVDTEGTQKKNWCGQTSLSRPTPGEKTISRFVLYGPL